MKCSKFLAVLAMVALVNCQGREKSELIFDFSGIESFCELCKSPDIDTSRIDDLISLPAYQGMIGWFTENWSSDLDQNAFLNIMRAVFFPEKYTVDEKYGRYSRIVKHITWARENYHQIEEYMDFMKPRLDSAAVLDRARGYLPDDVPGGTFVVYFVVGLTQGCASKESIFIDSEYRILQGDPEKYLMPWIAHELHHSWRERLPRQDRIVDPRYRGIVQALYWLETEGIAEMAGFSDRDLETYIETEAEKLKQGGRVSYRVQNYLQANAHLRNLNDAILAVLNGSSSHPMDDVVSTLASQDSNYVYHEVGHKMAYLIDRTQGRARLKSCVGKPKIFLLEYQTSAKSIRDPNKAYVFDDEVISGIDRLIWE